MAIVVEQQLQQAIRENDPIKFHKFVPHYYEELEKSWINFQNKYVEVDGCELGRILDGVRPVKGASRKEIVVVDQDDMPVTDPFSDPRFTTIHPVSTKVLDHDSGVGGTDFVCQMKGIFIAYVESAGMGRQKVSQWKLPDCKFHASLVGDMPEKPEDRALRFRELTDSTPVDRAMKSPVPLPGHMDPFHHLKEEGTFEGGRVASEERELRNQLIKLAWENPKIRKDILDILK